MIVESTNEAYTMMFTLLTIIVLSYFK